MNEWTNKPVCASGQRGSEQQPATHTHTHTLSLSLSHTQMEQTSQEAVIRMEELIASSHQEHAASLSRLEKLFSAAVRDKQAQKF